MNIQLFGKDQKKILFVLHDCSPDEDYDYIKFQITQDMKKIWNEIQKPIEMQGTKAEDFLEMYFEQLPHFLFQKKAFEEKVQVLKKRLIDCQD